MENENQTAANLPEETQASSVTPEQQETVQTTSVAENVTETKMETADTCCCANTECACCTSEEEPEKERVQQEPVAVTEEMIEKTKTTLVTMLDYLGLEGTVKAEGKPGKINLLIASNDAGRIIGRKGQSLESLQILVNRMMSKGEEPFPKVYIDIDGYSSNSKRGERRDGEYRSRGDRRGGRPHNHSSHFDHAEKRDFSAHDDDSEKDDHLRQQALDAAKEVRRWGQPVTLPPMNSHDRRIIHITLENESDLSTVSNGEGNFKSVTIDLKK